eukprot:TRINITY_DN33254_c0_g1_i1.p1 TRINITY_DN33254_c0_g1~~TRINITY_DN33254_c0_g1_i1.p1  ORF type:complete len:227 (-),score=18.89 TRINITY_DN33254_c0_g1_i1:40-720(-)
MRVRFLSRHCRLLNVSRGLVCRSRMLATSSDRDLTKDQSPASAANPETHPKPTAVPGVSASSSTGPSRPSLQHGRVAPPRGGLPPRPAVRPVVQTETPTTDDTSDSAQTPPADVTAPSHNSLAFMRKSLSVTTSAISGHTEVHPTIAAAAADEKSQAATKPNFVRNNPYLHGFLCFSLLLIGTCVGMQVAYFFFGDPEVLVMRLPPQAQSLKDEFTARIRDGVRSD